MKPTLLFFCTISILMTTQVDAQQTGYFDEEVLHDARRLFSEKDYGLAYSKFDALYKSINQSQNRIYDLRTEEIVFSKNVCALKLMMPGSRAETVHCIEQFSSPFYKRELQYHIGHHDYLSGDYESAISLFDAYLQGSTQTDNLQENTALFESGYSKFQLKDYGNAVIDLENVRRRKPNTYADATVFYIANCRYQLKQYDQALEEFSSISASEKYNDEVPYYIAHILYAQGKKDKALSYADSVLTTTGAEKYRSELGLLAAKLNFEKKAYSKALPSYELYLSAHPKVTKDILYEVSYCYYQTGSNSKAIEGFRQLSDEKDSIGQNSMYILGDLYVKQGDKNNARTAFQFCAGNSSNPIQQRVSRLNYARLSGELGFQDVALSEVRSYLKDYANTKDEAASDPTEHLTEAKELLITLLSNTTNYDEGLEIYKTMNKTSASARKIHARLLYGKGIKLLSEQQPSEAYLLFDEIVKENANPEVLPYARFWMGEIAFRSGNYDDCINNLNLFIKAAPAGMGEADLKNANYIMGYALMKKSQFKNANDFFSASLADPYSNAAAFKQDLQMRQADCMFMLREFSKADAMYKKLADANIPQSDYALYQRAVIAGIQNKSEKIRLLTTLSKQYPNSTYRNDVQMEIALTYINDEQYSAAIPYLQTILNDRAAISYKPQALLKLGLSYYNSNDNNQALQNYKQLVKEFPNSEEAEEAMPVIKDIYVEEGKAGDYLTFMQSCGIAVNVSEADSISYVVALKKYQSGDFNASKSAFENYVNTYPNGSYVLEAHYYNGYACKKTNDIAGAISNFDFVSSNGASKYYDDATLELSRLYYLEQKDYPNARKCFESLYLNSKSPDKQLEGMRGLVRCYYQLKDYSSANKTASDLLARNEVTTDDKAIAFLVLGKSALTAKDTAAAVDPLKSVVSINKTSWGAEARYELANAYFALNDLKLSEKTAMRTIQETGSYEYWVAKSYILIGDIYLRQKDYFNAKATYESVANNVSIDELKVIAKDKYNLALAEEKKSSKIK